MNKIKIKTKTKTTKQPLCKMVGWKMWNCLPLDPFPSAIHCVQVQNHYSGFVAFHLEMGGMHSGLGHNFW
jgi:hypothetical protein